MVYKSCTLIDTLGLFTELIDASVQSISKSMEPGPSIILADADEVPISKSLLPVGIGLSRYT